MSCEHENADHHQHVVNGNVVSEYLLCIDCGLPIGVKPVNVRGLDAHKRLPRAKGVVNRHG